MILSKIKVLRSHGRQAIPDLRRVTLPASFRGRPVLDAQGDPERLRRAAEICPTGAITAAPLSLDMGRCLFCGECALVAPDAVRFTSDHRIASCRREGLVVTPATRSIDFAPERVRGEVRRVLRRALKLRQVSAGGDNSTEMELNASMNVNFDFERYGVEFVASPRHADGIVVTGPLTANMARALEICHDAAAHPKVIVMAGCDAISGGLYAGSPAIDRSFLARHATDLWVPGSPVHPMVFIEGVLNLLGREQR